MPGGDSGVGFARTLSGAFATSLVNTAWDDEIKDNHPELAGLADPDGSMAQQTAAAQMSTEVANTTIDQLLTRQSVMLATNRIMLIGMAFLVAAFAIWRGPRPARAVEASGGH